MNIRHPPLSQSTLTANEAVGHFAVALPSDLRNVNTAHTTHAASHYTRSITNAAGTSINTHCNRGDGAAARVGIPDADTAASSGIFNLKRFIYRPERRAAAFRYVGLC